MMDNYEMWERHDAEQERQLQKLPECAWCKNPIQEEHLYLINGDYVCERCLDEHFKKRTENYMKG